MEGGKMKKMTSAYANKMLKSLEDEKTYWVNKEETSSTYVVANNEEPVVPEYDYVQVCLLICEFLSLSSDPAHSFQ